MVLGRTALQLLLRVFWANGFKVKKLKLIFGAFLMHVLAFFLSPFLFFLGQPRGKTTILICLSALRRGFLCRHFFLRMINSVLVADKLGGRLKIP